MHLPSPSLAIMHQADFDYAVWPEAPPERDFYLGGGGPQYDPMSLPRNRAPRMPWGKHRGKRFEQIPVRYFLFLERELGVVFTGELAEHVDRRLGRTEPEEQAA